VVEALAQMDNRANPSSTAPNEVWLQPHERGYLFHYFIRNRNKDRVYTTVFAEGRIWQDDEGTITVSGVARIDIERFFRWIGFYFLGSMILGLALQSILFFFIGIVFLEFAHISEAFKDRNRAVKDIETALWGTAETPDFSESRSENNDQTYSEPSIRPDSIWNDAVSEYDMLDEEK
jgi:hypothetical protein